MEKKPMNLNEITNPGYPTLSQVKENSKGATVAKVAAVTAIVGTMSLTTACGGMLGSLFGGKEVQLAGDVTTQVPTTEDTGEVLMGEETMYVPTDETTDPTTETTDPTTETTDYAIEGEMESYTEETTEYELAGDETVCVDTSDFTDPTDETVLDGDVIFFTSQTT